ncbi:hypothetical protein AALP_AA7G108000 [Arabis alpina]|uniref:AAA+ ATPase domain-containing protein n=2 Tax=Arabis alpina TaxID=50452 RepID=A0A087GH92_ARAAL|nr:hypothetical protein AALP_AA7G108000 [Arabis alpina]
MYRMMGWVSNSVHINFNEFTGEGLKRSGAYISIRNYLSTKSTACAKTLQANETTNRKALVLSLDDQETVEDEFEGVKVKWSSNVAKSVNQYNHHSGNNNSSERRCLTLSIHEKHREMITKTYLDYVLREGKKIGLENRERKLYTNNSQYVLTDGRLWSNVPFNHPATFETLAMDPEKKEGIKKDLIKFSKGKDYYNKVGKPWKRGYLLFGPPGTGKSTMISVMANFLEYDVYDLELTAVKDNLKEEEEEEEEDDKENMMQMEAYERGYKVTLSGLLNATDHGLWSACSDEKIMIFTTNFVDNLDPALIRRGRMDNHIEMSYCRFEAFKVLAKNYLDVEAHELYGEIKRCLEETDMSPADVAENLMPKSDEEDADICLKRLIKSLEEEKEKVRKLAEEEERKKPLREARRKKRAEEATLKKAEQAEKIKKMMDEEY